MILSYQEKYRCLFFYPKRKTVSIHRSDAYLRFYQDSVDKLRKIFNRLDLVMDGTPAIRFEDPEVFRVLLTEKVGNYQNIAIDSDGDGMLTYEEIAILTTLTQRRDGNQSLFTGNTVIETFNEFRFFTGLESINSSSFNGCSSLKEITLPVLPRMGSGAFASSGIEKLIIPEGYQIIEYNILQRCPNLILVDFPSTVTSISEGGSLFWDMKNQAIVICRALIPPVLGGFGYNGDPKAIYVPDTVVVDDYKSATEWSSQAAKIYPLSTYVEL